MGPAIGDSTGCTVSLGENLQTVDLLEVGFLFSISLKKSPATAKSLLRPVPAGLWRTVLADLLWERVEYAMKGTANPTAF